MKKIAIIEDNSEINNLIRNILIYENFEIEQYFNGQEVLNNLNKIVKNHIILLDVMLPGLNGLEIFNKLKEQYPEAVKKILFLTAKSDEETLTFFEQEQCQYIVKPFDPYKFLGILKKFP